MSYLEGGGTLGERERARLISADREQWFDDITCSGTDNVELWKSLPFDRYSETNKYTKAFAVNTFAQNASVK